MFKLSKKYAKQFACVVIHLFFLFFYTSAWGRFKESRVHCVSYSQQNSGKTSAEDDNLSMSLQILRNTSVKIEVSKRALYAFFNISSILHTLKNRSRGRPNPEQNCLTSKGWESNFKRMKIDSILIQRERIWCEDRCCCEDETQLALWKLFSHSGS